MCCITPVEYQYPWISHRTHGCDVMASHGYASYPWISMIHGCDAAHVTPTLYATGTGQLKKSLISGLRHPIVCRVVGKLSWHNMDYSNEYLRSIMTLSYKAL